jgi:lipopolysaccharide biosynthesis regulator YciM
MQVEQSTAHGSPFQEHRPDVIFPSLDHLLTMAQRYRSEGKLRQAMDLYWVLLEDHPETTQAQGARGGLLELADVYEHDGLRHQARAIYERLSDSHARSQVG